MAESADKPSQDDEAALLQQALAMSMDDDKPMADITATDPDLALALHMSVEAAKEDNAGASGSDMNKVLADQSFVSSILSSLPGVDPNDPTVKSLLESLQPEQEKKKEDKPDKSEEK